MDARCPWLVVILVASGAVADTARVYRWTDADGVLHFSDVPPADRAAEPVDVDPARLISVPPPPVVPRDERPPPATRPKQGASASARRAEREKRCQAARQKIENIHAKMRAGYSGRQGERLREQLRGYEKDRVEWCMGRGQ